MTEQARTIQPAIDISELIPIGISLAEALAGRHAQGHFGNVEGVFGNVMGDHATISLQQNQVPTSESPSAAQDDIRDAARLLMSATLSSLPTDQHISNEHLYGHLCWLRPDLSPELMSVLGDAVGQAPNQPIPDAVTLWARLLQAQAVATVRAQCPENPQLGFQIAHDTHIGLHKSRMGQVNQDALYYQQHFDDSTGRRDVSVDLLVVADGISVSTAGSGDLASALLVQTLASAFQSESDRLLNAEYSDIETFLNEVIHRANEVICRASVQLVGGALGQEIPMGTTCIIAIIKGSDVVLASLGDSRAYLVSSSGVGLLTGDQNLRGEWLWASQSDVPFDLQGRGHALVGYVGHFDENGAPEALRPTIRRITMLPGETLVMCTDGLTDYAATTHTEIAKIINSALDADDLMVSARTLVNAANAAGGGDNITVLIARSCHL